MAPAEGAWSPRGRRERLHGHSQRRRSVIGMAHTQGSACGSYLRCSDLGEVACRYRRDFLKSVPFAENEAWIYPHTGLELLTPLTYHQTFMISYLKCPNHLRGLQWAPRSSSMKMQEWKAWLVSEGVAAQGERWREVDAGWDLGDASLQNGHGCCMKNPCQFPDRRCDLWPLVLTFTGCSS